MLLVKIYAICAEQNIPVRYAIVILKKLRKVIEMALAGHKT